MSDNNKTNSKVFVGRLPEGCTTKDLEDLFSTYGSVKQCDVIGKYGFVHMIKREEAEEAIKKLNNYNFMGSQLTVQFSTSKMQSGSGKGKRASNTRRPKRSPNPRNNAYPPSSAPPYDAFGPPPVPPNRFGVYYEDIRPQYSYGESDAYYRESSDNMRSLSYEPSLYGRRPPNQSNDYSRPVPPEFYDRGDVHYSRPPPYDINRAILPTDTRMSFGGPTRNGFGGNMGYPNRGPVGGHRPPPPATSRWQPY